jgi:hypothetical protein
MKPVRKRPVLQVLAVAVVAAEADSRAIAEAEALTNGKIYKF